MTDDDTDPLENGHDKVENKVKTDDDGGTDTRAQVEDTAAEVGRWLAAGPLFVWSTFVGVLQGILLAILGRIPKRTSVYQAMVKAGYKGLYKKTDAHVVCNTIYRDGELKPRPAQLDTETNHLETANGETWTTEGLQEVRVGDVPVVTGVADQHELVDHIAARTAEAVDYSDKRWQQVKQTNMGMQPVETMTAGSSTGAVADGGQAQVPAATTFDDIWVDTSNPNPENDGWVVSMAKAYDLHWDRGASEEFENQETRGILSEKDPESDKKQMILIIAAVIGSFCLGLFGPALASNIAGSAAGAASGGGGVPLAVDLVGWLL